MIKERKVFVCLQIYKSKDQNAYTLIQTSDSLSDGLRTHKTEPYLR